MPGAGGQPSRGEAEAELHAAVGDLRAAAGGKMSDPENVEAAHRCLALALFASAWGRLRVGKPTEETRDQLREALSLAPGLGEERRDEARRYLAYATYAVGKEKLEKREFAAAAGCFQAVVDPEGTLKRWLGREQQAAAKRYLADCEAAVGIQAISTVQDWVEAHKLQKLTPALDELGAEAGEGVAILMELEPDDIDALRNALPKLKQRKFDRALGELKQFYDPELKQTYLVPTTFTLSGATKFVFGASTRTVTAATTQTEASTGQQIAREPPPEYAIGEQIQVWRHGDDVVACEVKEELGRGAQAVVYRVESEGAVRALKVARVLAIANEARVMLRVNAPQRHPHVLEVSYVCSPAGRGDELIFLQQLIEGETLARLIHSGRLYEGESEAVPQRLQRLFVQLLSALAHVHSCGVLHQDVKPDNVMIDPRTWDLCIIDFGIAALGLAGRAGRVTAMVKGGTPSHCSPEHRKLLLYVGDARDPAERRRRVHEQPLTQCADLWGAAAICLDAFAGGSSWRRGKPSCDAWHGERPVVSAIGAAVEWRVPVPAQLAEALDFCLAGGDATAQQAVGIVVDAGIVPASTPGLARALACSMYANIGLALYNRGCAADAEACLRDALDAGERRDPRALNNLGVVLAAKGERSEAECCFRDALALDADYQEANANLAHHADEAWAFVLDEREGASAMMEQLGEGAGESVAYPTPLRYARGQRLRVQAVGHETEHEYVVDKDGNESGIHVLSRLGGGEFGSERVDLSMCDHALLPAEAAERPLRVRCFLDAAHSQWKDGMVTSDELGPADLQSALSSERRMTPFTIRFDNDDKDSAIDIEEDVEETKRRLREKDTETGLPEFSKDSAHVYRFKAPFCACEVAPQPPQYVLGQPVRVLFDRSWRHAVVKGRVLERSPAAYAVSLDGKSEALVTLDLNEANQACALLDARQMLEARVRFRRASLERFGSIVDAWSGEILDMGTQMASVQYKTGVRYTHVTRRKGAAIIEQHEGATDAVELLRNAMSPVEHIDHGNFGGQPCTLIVGPAASGKTTLLRQFVLHAVDEQELKFVPLFITVVDLVRVVFAARKAGCAVMDQFVRTQSEAGNHVHGRFVWQAIRERRALFLIDGLDEAGDARGEVEKFVAERLISRGHRVMLTLREAGLTEQLRRQFTRENGSRRRQVVHLLPLSQKQREAMVRSRLPDPLAFWADAREPHYVELVENPLMLSMLLSMFKRMGGRLPARRSELYEKALEAMLNRADAARKAQRYLGRAELDAFLRQLAFASHRRQGEEFRIFTGADVRCWGETGELLGFEGVGEDGWSQAWVQARRAAVEGGLPILVFLGHDEAGEEKFQFSHLVFQEYYCAAELARRFCEETGGRGVFLARLLRVRSDVASCAAHALEDARWHVVVQMCGELLLSGQGVVRLRRFAEAFLECDGGKLKLEAGVRDPGALALATMLRSSNTLTELDVMRSELGLQGAMYIADVLPDCPTLARLTINASIDIGKLKAASKADLSGMGLKAEDTIIVVKCAEMNDALTDLDLTNNEIGIEGANAISAALARCKLKRLAISGRGVKVLDVEELRTSKSIDWSHRGLTAEDLIVVATCIENNDALESLDLSHNKVGAQGAKAICTLLQKMSSSSALTSINLLKNDIDGVAEDVVRSALKCLPKPKIHTLCGLAADQKAADFSEQRLGVADVQLLRLDLYRLERLTINVEINVKELRKTHKNVDLRGRGLKLAEAIVVGICMQQNEELSWLNLLNNDMGQGVENILAAAANHSSIATLCGINDGQEHANLAHPDFQDQKLTAADMQLLAFDFRKRSSLTSANLIGKVMEDAASAIVIAAGERRGKIKTLCGIESDQHEANFAGQGLVAADARLLAFDLKSNMSLAKLDLRDNKLRAEGAKHISDAIRSRTSASRSARLGTRVASFSSAALTHLDLRSNDLGAEGAKYVSYMLPSSVVTHLDLQSNAIGDEGAAHLRLVLPQSLMYLGGRYLNLVDNNISDKVALKPIRTTKAMKLFVLQNSRPAHAHIIARGRTVMNAAAHLLPIAIVIGLVAWRHDTSRLCFAVGSLCFCGSLQMLHMDQETWQERTGNFDFRELALLPRFGCSDLGRLCKMLAEARAARSSKAEQHGGQDAKDMEGKEVDDAEDDDGDAAPCWTVTWRSRVACICCANMLFVAAYHLAPTKATSFRAQVMFGTLVSNFLVLFCRVCAWFWSVRRCMTKEEDTHAEARVSGKELNEPNEDHVSSTHSDLMVRVPWLQRRRTFCCCKQETRRRTLSSCSLFSTDSLHCMAFGWYWCQLTAVSFMTNFWWGIPGSTGGDVWEYVSRFMQLSLFQVDILNVDFRAVFLYLFWMSFAFAICMPWISSMVLIRVQKDVVWERKKHMRVAQDRFCVPQVRRLAEARRKFKEHVHKCDKIRKDNPQLRLPDWDRVSSDWELSFHEDEASQEACEEFKKALGCAKNEANVLLENIYYTPDVGIGIGDSGESGNENSAALVNNNSGENQAHAGMVRLERRQARRQARTSLNAFDPRGVSLRNMQDLRLDARLAQPDQARSTQLDQARDQPVDRAWIGLVWITFMSNDAKIPTDAVDDAAEKKVEAEKRAKEESWRYSRQEMNNLQEFVNVRQKRFKNRRVQHARLMRSKMRQSWSYRMLLVGDFMLLCLYMGALRMLAMGLACSFSTACKSGIESCMNLTGDALQAHCVKLPGDCHGVNDRAVYDPRRVCLEPDAHMWMVLCGMIGIAVVYPTVVMMRPVFQIKDETLTIRFTLEFIFVFVHIQTFVLFCSVFFGGYPLLIATCSLMADILLVIWFSGLLPLREAIRFPVRCKHRRHPFNVCGSILFTFSAWTNVCSIVMYHEQGDYTASFMMFCGVLLLMWVGCFHCRDFVFRKPRIVRPDEFVSDDLKTRLKTILCNLWAKHTQEIAREHLLPTATQTGLGACYYFSVVWPSQAHNLLDRCLMVGLISNIVLLLVMMGIATRPCRAHRATTAMLEWSHTSEWMVELPVGILTLLNSSSLFAVGSVVVRWTLVWWSMRDFFKKRLSTCNEITQVQQLLLKTPDRGTTTVNRSEALGLFAFLDHEFESKANVQLNIRQHAVQIHVASSNSADNVTANPLHPQVQDNGVAGAQAGGDRIEHRASTSMEAEAAEARAKAHEKRKKKNEERGWLREGTGARSIPQLSVSGRDSVDSSRKSALDDAGEIDFGFDEEGGADGGEGSGEGGGDGMAQDDWQKQWDDESQAHYYWNSTTGETRWEMPTYERVVMGPHFAENWPWEPWPQWKCDKVEDQPTNLLMSPSDDDDKEERHAPQPTDEQAGQRAKPRRTLVTIFVAAALALGLVHPTLFDMCALIVGTTVSFLWLRASDRTTTRNNDVENDTEGIGVVQEGTRTVAI